MTSHSHYCAHEAGLGFISDQPAVYGEQTLAQPTVRPVELPTLSPSTGGGQPIVNPILTAGPAQDPPPQRESGPRQGGGDYITIGAYAVKKSHVAIAGGVVGAALLLKFLS